MSSRELDSLLTYELLTQISSVTSLLAECGAKNVVDKGSYFSFSSPFREDKNPSMVLYKSNMVCVDFGGTVGGSFSYFFFKSTGVSLVKYLDLGQMSFLDKTYFDKGKKTTFDNIDLDSKKEFRIKEGRIQYDFSKSMIAQSFIRRRFLSHDFIKTFQIGYCTSIKACRAPLDSFRDPDLKFTTFKNRLCIPIYHSSELISLEGRDLTGKAKTKVLYPKGAGAVSNLFNYDNLDKSKPLVVVEGILDMPRIWQYVTKNVTTTFGVNITSEQKEQLKQFDHVILLSDSDEAGRNMVNYLDKFMDKPFWVARLSHGDPGDPTISIEELQQSVQQAKESTAFYLDESELFQATDFDKSYFSN